MSGRSGFIVTIIALVAGVVALVSFLVVFPGIGGRVSRLEDALQTQADELSRLVGQVGEIPEDLALFRELMGTLETRMAAYELMETDFQAMVNVLEEQGSVVASLSGELVVLENRLTANEESASALSAVLATYEDRFVGFESTVQALTLTFGERVQEMEALRTSVADAVTGIETLSASLADLDRRYAAVLLGMNDKGTRLVALEEKLVVVDQLNRDVEDLSGAMQGLRLDQRLQAVLNVIDIRVREITELLNTLRAEMEREMAVTQEDRERIDQLYAALRQELTGQQESLRAFREEAVRQVATLRDEVEESLANITEKTATMIEHTGEQALRIDELTGRLTTLAESLPVPEVLNDLQREVSEAITRVEEKVTGIQAEVTQKTQNLSAELALLQGQVEELNRTLGELQAGLTEQSSRLEGFERGVQEVIDTFGLRIVGIEESLTSLKVTEEDLRSQVADQEKTLSLVSAKLGTVENRLQVLASDIERDLRGIIAEVSDASERVRQELSLSLGEALQDVPTPETIAALRDDLTAVAMDKEGLRMNVEEINRERERILEDLGNKSVQLAQLQESVVEAVSQAGTSLELSTELSKKMELVMAEKSGLSERLSETENALVVLDGDFAVLNDTWKNIAGRIEEQLKGLHAQMNQVQVQLAELTVAMPEEIPEEQFEAFRGVVEQTLDGLASRIETLEFFKNEMNRLELDAKIFAVEGNMANVEARIAELVATIETQVPDIGELRDALDELRENRMEIRSDIEELYRKYEQIEEVATTGQQIETLEEERVSIIQQIERLAGEKTTLQEALTKRQEEAAGISGEIERLRGEREALQDIRVLEEQKTAVEQESARLQRELADRLGQIDLLQNRIAELAHQLDERARYTSYIILPWDNLWNIALRYYRDGSKWELILEANRDVIDDIYNLRPYTEIRIPRISAPAQK
ncbi:MAG TPA: hypothetical protein VLH40_02490 [Atribacteraceae bacterium]|nr:hypothetical protein [Atribacteraceae bacterium]